MRNKGLVITITSVIFLLCIYYLSFSLVSQGVKSDARDFATDDNGNVNLTRQASYLDSIRREPVIDILGLQFTYKEVEENELSLGLDLQGGMHVTLEVSPVDIIKGLSGNSNDAEFLAAIADAREAQRTSNSEFSDLFYTAYEDRSGGKPLAYIFANVNNRDRLQPGATDDEVRTMIDEEIDGAIDRSFNILRTRIDRFGTSQPNIQRIQGTGRIQIELPGVEDPERVRKIIQSVAKLEFWEVHFPYEIQNTLLAINSVLVEDAKAKAAEEAATGEGAETEAGTSTEVDGLGGESQDEELDNLGGLEELGLGGDADTDSSLAAADSLGTSDSTGLDDTQVSEFFTKQVQLYANVFGYSVRDTAAIGRILRREDIQAIIPSDVRFLWGAQPVDVPSLDDEVIAFYAIKTNRDNEAPITGDVITNARQDLDERARPAVNMQMDPIGGRDWRNLTRSNVGRMVAVVLDNLVYSAPTVQGEIPDGSSVISGDFTIEEARDLANILKAGALPAPTRIVEEAVVGPTLGKEAIRQGVLSIMAGLGVVIIFMILYYARGGAIANIALLLNIFLVLGLLAQLDAALTLPGIAGIVLTIGMSIDANVLIFERIREELRSGVNLKTSVKNGFNRAFSSIIDANVTTFLTGVVLYTLGQGPVKGFAVTLMVGIISSLLLAVFITRIIVEFATAKGEASKMNFATGFSKGLLSKFNFDFLSKRRTAYIASSTLIALGLVVVFVFKLNLGVDFKGGRSYVVAFPTSVVASEYKEALTSSLDGASVESKIFGASNQLKITTTYLVDDESEQADAQVRERVIAGIAQYSNLSFTNNDEDRASGEFAILSSSKVGATIADDIQRKSNTAIIISLVIIFIYILIRFLRWQFSLGAVAALFHDVLIVIGAFAIAGLAGAAFEVDQVFIAAILTIVGYSINDTVVVFDRIRENLNEHPKAPLEENFNNALNSTINRTVVTSLTTLIVVIVLLIFGGAVLRGFSFALFIGILAGTYSSLFIATPIAIDTMKRKAKKEVAKAKA